MEILAASAFAYSIRMLVCPNCGAPIRAPLEGGTVDCEYCRVQSLVTARVVEPLTSQVAEHTEADPNAARLARLRARSLDPQYLSPYDITKVPAELRALVNAPPASNLDATRRAWSAARAQIAPGAPLEAQRRLFLLTSLLRNTAISHGELALARAAADTTLDLFGDAGFRLSVRCMIAGSAVRAGDIAAAEQWLASCDPRPEELSLDTEVRLTTANIALAREDFDKVLQTLGQTHDQLPLAAAGVPLATLYRVHALERMAETERAFAEMKWLCGRSFPAGGGAAIAQAIIRTQAWRQLCEKSAPLATQAIRTAQRRVLIAFLLLAGLVTTLVWRSIS